MSSDANQKNALIRDSVLFHTETLRSYGLQNHLNIANLDEAVTQEQALTENILKEMKADQPMAQPQKIETKPEDLSEVSTLNDLHSYLQNCERCKLHAGRTNIVFGVGNPAADLMFVGEGPGQNEDEQGEPFVGRAGKLLTKMIEAMGLTREDIYIANVVKCRPPSNRNPEPDEIDTCMPFLKKQIAVIQPKVIVCLGKFAAQTVLNTAVPISKLRGRFHEREGTLIMPTFHPAYLLRNASMKKFAWDDLKQVMEKLGL